MRYKTLYHHECESICMMFNTRSLSPELTLDVRVQYNAVPGVSRIDHSVTTARWTDHLVVGQFTTYCPYCSKGPLCTSNCPSVCIIADNPQLASGDCGWYLAFTICVISRQVLVFFLSEVRPTRNARGVKTRTGQDSVRSRY
jgi:hypothetical protein